MSTITTRAGKGSPLTNNEVDANFTNLNTDKAELSGAAFTGAITTTSTVDGRDVATDGSKLDGIEAGATADQTAAEIKTAYESNADTNAFTDADESKLDGIEASADVTDTANVTAAGALMDSELTSEASVKALNQGVATGDSPTFAGLNASGDLTLDVAGDIILDADGGDVIFKDGGALRGSLKAGTNAAFELKSLENNADFVIKGIDNNAEITALTLDMSAAGAATFNAGVTVGGNSTFNAPNINITADDARLLIEEADGTDIVWLGDITGAGVGGCFLYNHGGTATTQLRADSASTIGHGLDVTGTATMDGLTVDGNATFSGSVTTENYFAVIPPTTTNYAYMDYSNAGGSMYVGRERSSASGLLTGSTAYAGVINVTGAYPLEFGTNNSKRMTIDSSGNVGIGTSSPSQAKLDILLESDYSSHTGHGLSILSNANNAYTALYMGTDDTIDSAYIQSAGRNTSFTSKSLLLNPNGGNVGIGLTNPSDYYAENLVVAAPAEGGITIKSASTDQAYLMFADGTSGSDSYRGYIGHNHSTDATSLVSFGTIDLSSVAETVFTTASTERMRIDSSGRVGLGVSPISSPAGFSKTVLSLAGTAAPSVVLKQSTGNHMEWGLSANGGWFGTSNGYSLRFITNNDERMRIDASGKVGIGVSPTGSLHTTVKDSNGSDVYVVAQNTTSNRLAGFKVLDEGGTASLLMQYDNGGNVASISNPNNGSLAIYLGGTGAANKLDDYEEGTWTPDLTTSSGTAPTLSLTTAGTYTKVGRLVTVIGYIQIDSISGTVSNTVNIANLPFNAGSVGNGYMSAGSMNVNGITFANSPHGGLSLYNQNRLAFLTAGNGGGWGWELFSIFSNGDAFRFSISYYAA